MIKEINLDDINKMLKKNTEDKIYCEQVSKEITEYGYVKSIPDEFFIQRMVVEDRHSPGLIVRHPHGTVMQQEKLSNYYRGESSLYGSSKSSLDRQVDREEPENLKEKLVYYFIAEMRIGEFIELINKFDVVENWPWDVLYRALAQHYGIPTNWMDITNDFETALFFACCKYEKGKYRPLKNTDFKTKNDRYGVLYKADSFLSDLKYGGFNSKRGIMPIGFQPFMRCHRQYGYAYVMEEGMDLYKNEDFQMMKFKHSIDLSEQIFEYMEGGDKIFPQEGLKYVNQEIEEIKKASNFSRQVFEQVKNNFDFRGITLDIKEELKSKGINIGEAPVNISEEKIHKINKDYKKIEFSKESPLPPHTRLVYNTPEAIYISLNQKKPNGNQ